MFKKSLVLSAFIGLMVASSVSAQSYVAKPGDLLRTADDATVVLVLDNGTRVPVSADAYAMRYHNDFSLVKTVTASERGSYSGDSLNSMTSLHSGEVFIYELDQPGIFIVENGFKRLFSSWTGFEAMGNSFNDIVWVGSFTQYPTGAPVM